MWHLWGIGERHIEVWWGNPTARDRLEDVNVDLRVILKRMLVKVGRRNGTNSSGSEYEQARSSCEHVNVSFHCMKYVEFLE
jgi:hypothetical protein